MWKRLLIGALVVGLFVGSSTFAGQNTGGDKARRTTTAAAPGLNPQPLPPGRHRYRREHKHRHVGKNYSAQRGGYRRHPRYHRHPNAITVKQK